MKLIKSLCALLSVARADVLSDYVAAPEEVYDWFEYTNLTFTTNWGNTGRVLNVTTQKWMDESRAAGPRGAIWDHEVIVVIPKDLEFTHIATVTMFGSCNGNPGAAINVNNNNILKIDELAHNSKTIAVGIL
jgi:PhoPQ-activated pathogenicity-related protein